MNSTMDTINFSHVSVMPQEVIEYLDPSRGGIYIDGTLGGGGHSKLILDKLPLTGRLICIDRDSSAIAAAKKHISGSHAISGTEAIPQRVTFVKDNFHNIPDILQSLNVPYVDGVLLDLGVSSHQLDTPERGFSFRFDGPLDMRMDMQSDTTAADIVNNYDEKDLANLIFAYGEERHSRRIARAICTAREHSPILTTGELADIIQRAVPKQKFGMPHPAMRSFMAIRIAVNDELSPLGGVIQSLVKCLAPGGRIGIITFHSLEDRIVKTKFSKLASPCECPRDIPYCVCGKKPEVRVITRKPLLPTAEELEENRRSHSAKFRVAEKL